MIAELTQDYRSTQLEVLPLQHGEYATSAFLQETGLVGVFAQGLGAKSEGGTLADRQNQVQGAQIAGIVSMLIPVWPGGTYLLHWTAAASPATIQYGFYMRVHLLGADASGQPDATTDTTFETTGDVTLQPGISSVENPGTGISALAPDSQQWTLNFQVPLSGAGSVTTSVGQSILSGTISFTPAFLYLEPILWDPVSSGTSGTAFAIVDDIKLVNLSDGSAANSSSGNWHLHWSSSTTYQPGNVVDYSGQYWISLTTNTNSTPSSSSTDWIVAQSGGKVMGASNDNLIYSSIGFVPQGSLVGGGDNSVFSYSANSTDISIWNTSTTVPLPNGTILTISATGSSGSPAWTFTGLTASTSYHFGGYLQLSDDTVHVVMSDNSTSAGSQTWLVQTLEADGHVPLFIDWIIATPASGSSSGGGSPGGGSATCPAEDQFIETKEQGFIPAIDLKTNMHVRGWQGEWNKILGIATDDGWLHHVKIGGETLHVDLNHRWLPATELPNAPYEKWQPSIGLKVGDLLQTSDGLEVAVEEISPPHFGKFVKIIAERQRFRLGTVMSHNYYTI